MRVHAEEAREAAVGHLARVEDGVRLREEAVLVERAPQHELDLDVGVLVDREGAVRLDQQEAPAEVAEEPAMVLGRCLLVRAEVERAELGAPGSQLVRAAQAVQRPQRVEPGRTVGVRAVEPLGDEVHLVRPEREVDALHASRVDAGAAKERGRSLAVAFPRQLVVVDAREALRAVPLQRLRRLFARLAVRELAELLVLFGRSGLGRGCRRRKSNAGRHVQSEAVGRTGRTLASRGTRSGAEPRYSAEQRKPWQENLRGRRTYIRTGGRAAGRGRPRAGSRRLGQPCKIKYS